MAEKKCFVDGCLSCSTREEDTGVTYHKYPKEESFQAQWASATRQSLQNTKLPHYVCSRHFRKSDFKGYKDSKFILKSDAVPSIFPWSKIKIDTIENKTMDASENQPDDPLEELSVDVSVKVDTSAKDTQLSPSLLPPVSEIKHETDHTDNSQDEIALNDSKQSEGESIEAIKKFIEKQEQEILELQAEVKCVKINDVETTDTVKTEGNIKAEDSIKEFKDKSAGDAGVATEDAGDSSQDTFCVASSVMGVILSEAEVKLEKKKKARGSTSKEKAKSKVNSTMSLSVGTKIEAKDYSGSWHPATIVEVDYDEMEVLVQYEEYVFRKQDEWISASSPRIRPLCSPRAPGRAAAPASPAPPAPPAEGPAPPAPPDAPRAEFELGERCLARWRDNRRFAATVQAHLGGDKYEIVFDDGAPWVCASGRLYKMKDSVHDVKIPLYDAPAPPALPPGQPPGQPPPPYHTHLFDPSRDYLGSKSERRAMKRKINIKEIFNIGQKRRREEVPPRPRPARRPPAPKKTKVKAGRLEPVGVVEVKKEPPEPPKPRTAADALADALADAVAESVAEPVDEPMDESMAESMSEPIAEHVAEPMAETVAEPMAHEVQVELVTINPESATLDDTNEEEEVPVKEEPTAAATQQPASPPHGDLLSQMRPSVVQLEDVMKPARPEPEPPRPLKVKKQKKKLRYIQEKKVKREVERVKSELEAMKSQLEHLKMEVGKKTQELYQSPEPVPLPESCLLPGEWCCKWVGGEPVGTVCDIEADLKDGTRVPRRSVKVEDKRLPEGWTKIMARRSFGTSAGKWDVVLMNPDNRKFHTKTDMRLYLEAAADPALEPHHAALYDFGVHRKLSRRLGWDRGGAPAGAGAGAGAAGAAGAGGKRSLSLKRQKKKLSLRKEKPAVASSSAAAAAAAPAVLQPEFPPLEDGYVYVGSLKVQIIENLLRCPAAGCFKNFRNDPLLKMHIKHYHRDLRKMLGATPKVADLAYARAAPPKVEGKRRKKPKEKRPPAEPATPAKADSPRLRDALQARPGPRRPRVLLPVRRLETALDVKSEPDDSPDEPLPDAMDFEAAISTHTVTKPPADKKRRERVLSKVPRVSEDEWLGSSDVDTRSSCPRSGSAERPAAPVAPPAAPAHEHAQNTYMFTETGERIKIVRMRREEIINCHCGVREEDGLMIQCELCLCWQHALCHNIQREAEVPDKYTCSICLEPRRGRRSARHRHCQERLYAGALPGAPPAAALRRAHELAGNLLRVQDALHALRVKYYVATKKDHPKLYLWAKEWEADAARERLAAEYADLGLMIGDIGKENLPLKMEDVNGLDMSSPLEGGGSPKPPALGALASPGAASLDLPISAAELERLAKSVQESELSRTPLPAPQPEAAIEDGACRERLLRHIQRCQAAVDVRLDSIEAQVAELESQDPSLEDDETPDYFPRTKQTIQMLLRDLTTMEELGVIT